MPTCLHLLAAFSRYPAALDWAKQRAREVWGDIYLESPRRDFDDTDYYQPAMGTGLIKVLWAFFRFG